MNTNTTTNATASAKIKNAEHVQATILQNRIFPPEACADLNDANRAIVEAMNELYPGHVAFFRHHEKGYSIYRHERIFNFCANFCVPACSEKFGQLCAEHNSCVKTGIISGRLFKLLEMCGGKILIWS